MIETIEIFLKNHRYILTALTAIGTIGMCFVALQNILITKKEVIYKNKIIATRNIIYTMLSYLRGQLTGEILVKCEVLKYFICLFLLKKEKVEDGFIIKNEFDFEDKNKQTSQEMKRKIEDFVKKLSDKLSDFNDRSPSPKELNEFLQFCKEILGMYCFGDNYTDNKEYKNLITQIDRKYNETCFFTQKSIIHDDDPEDIQTINTMFYNYQTYQQEQLEQTEIEKYNSIFQKFTIPTYKQAEQYHKKLSYLKDVITYSSFNEKKIQFERYAKIFIHNYEDLSYLEKYEQINKTITSEISSGFVMKISEDLEEEGFYYLEQFWFLKKWFLKLQKKYQFKKFKKQYIIQQKEDPMLFTIGCSISPKYGFQVKLKKIIQQKQKHN